MAKQGDGVGKSAPGSGDPLAAVRAGWRRQWQAPALLAGAALLAGGLAVGVATRPDPDLGAPISRAEALVSQERYEEALEVLNTAVLPYVGTADLGAAHEGRYHLAVARAVDRWQRTLGFEHEKNLQTVVREYRAADRLEAELTPEDRRALALALVSLGRHEEALAAAEAIPAKRLDLRVSVWRASVDRRLRRPPRDPDGALGLLTRMLTDPELPVDDRVWALARQSDVMLDRGFAAEVVTRLLRELPRVERDAGAEAMGSLYLRLGKAYLDESAVEEAGKQFERADRLLADGSPLRAEVLYYRGRVRELRGEVGEARDLFAAVVTRHAQSDAYGRALVGLGEMEAALRAIPESLEAYGLAAAALEAGDAEGLTREELTRSLLARWTERMVEADSEQALRYAALAESVWDKAGEDATPPEVFEAVARASRAGADRLLGGDGTGTVEVTPAELSRVDPGTRREAQRLLVRAGYYYRRHADRFVVADPVRYAASLWLAAESYDLAGDVDEAVNAFRQFVADLPSEARHPEARYRLGRAYQAKGEHGLAAQAFEGVIADGREGVNPIAGPWAERSLVPLAESLLADELPENDARAGELLERVLSGEAGGADTQQFRAALHAAAGMHYQRGEYRPAVERYEEILRRYPDDEKNYAVRFRLADSYRRLAEEKRRELEGVMRDGDRRAIARERSAWLSRAMELFDAAREALERIPEARRSGLDGVMLRNAHFYLGDCAFDMGDYTAAIRFYSGAKDRYPRDPASLVALVQIVNAYIRLDDVASAQAANNRARLFFESLPDSVWNDPDLPMGREDWERWLDSSELLDARVAGVPEGGGR